MNAPSPATRAGDPLVPIAVALAVAPIAVVLQSKAIAPIGTLALLLAVLLHRRGLLFLWAALSTAWAIEPLRALATSLQLGGFVLLGAAAARVAGAGTQAEKARLLRWATAGLVLGLAAAAFDALYAAPGAPA